jgi:hypothetical protein
VEHLKGSGDFIKQNLKNKKLLENKLMKPVACNKLSLLLKIILENAQALELFTKILKTESIYKSN